MSIVEVHWKWEKVFKPCLLRNLTYCNGFRFQTTYIPKIIWAPIFKSYLPLFYVSSKVTRNKIWVCRHYISQYLCDGYFIFLCTAARWKMKAIFIQNMEPLHQMRVKWLNIKKPSPSDVKSTHKDKIPFLFFPRAYLVCSVCFAWKCGWNHHTVKEIRKGCCEPQYLWQHT